jgi:hypothetical protein
VREHGGWRRVGEHGGWRRVGEHGDQWPAAGGYPWWPVAGWHAPVVAFFYFYFFQIFSYLIGLTCGPSKMNIVFATSAQASGPAGQKYYQFAINQ